MKISEILETAASPEYLWDGYSATTADTREWTCLAISLVQSNAGYDRYEHARAWYEETYQLPYSNAFIEYAAGPSRQKARRDFLVSAAEAARQQGL